MGWDIWLKINTGKKKYYTVEALGGCTYNVSDMFQLAGIERLSNFDGQNCSNPEILAKLKFAINDMKKYPEKSKPLNPDNGWGSYESALLYLKKLYRGCLRHPNAIISICY